MHLIIPQRLTITTHDVTKLIGFCLDREELLLQDCEWKIRATEKACKERLTAAEQLKKEAIKNSEKIAAESKAQLDKVRFHPCFYVNK